MKTSKFVINHIKKAPSFSKLQEQDMLRNILDILPIKLKSGIKFLFIKNDILYFVLTNRIYIMEFKYNLKTIKNLILEFEKFTNKKLNVIDVKYFVSKYQEIQRVEYTKDTHIFYHEQSSSNFENLAKDRDIKEKIEEIRGVICSKR